MATGPGPSTQAFAQALATIAGFSPVSLQPPSAPLPAAIPPSSANVTPGQSRTPSALQMLPSYLRRRGTGENSKPKKPKTIKTWDRDVLCLPNSRQNMSSGGNIKFPRGKYRSELAKEGLIGKLHLTSEMTDVDVANEIRSIFSGPMGNNAEFPFLYLQPTGGGSKSLTVPAQSSSFKWVPQQVARLSGQSGTMYILAQAELSLQEGIEEDGDDSSTVEPPETPPIQHGELKEDSEVVVARSVHTPTVSRAATSSRTRSSVQSESYREYVGLIDLTQESVLVVASDSEPEELPAISVDTSHDDDKVDATVIKHVIQQHQHRVIQSADEEDVQRLHIRRSHVLSDALQQFSRKLFDVTKMLKVHFIGESAVDTGGPRREFFHLVTHEIFKSSLFAGFPAHVVPVHNVEAIAKNTYHTIGKILATCIIQGGEVPVCLAKPVADYLVYDRIRSPMCLEDIADCEVQESLGKVQLANSTEELQTLVNGEKFNFRFNCGYTKPVTQITLENREDFLRSIWLHFVLFNPHAELEQFRKGLNQTLQFEILVVTQPNAVWQLLAASTAFEVTAEYLCDAFAVQYSDNGSNNRTKEEAIVYFWSEYVSECAERKDVSLGDTLQFISGSSKLPATGFDKTPKICFTGCDCLPTVSTCDLSITFPRCMGLLSYENFTEKMDFCILGSHGFGAV